MAIPHKDQNGNSFDFRLLKFVKNFWTSKLATHVIFLVQDLRWYFARQTPVIKVVGGLAVFVIGFFLATYPRSDRILPNVSVAGIDVGGLSATEAETVMLTAWVNDTRIEINGGDHSWTASPVELGLQLDVSRTVHAASNVGLTTLIFGRDLEPVVTFDSDRAQNFLLNLADQAGRPPYSAGFEWQEDELVGVDGRPGRALNIPATLDYLSQSAESIARLQRISLQYDPLQPATIDPTPYLDEAQIFTTQPFELKGYDPFTDEHFGWTTDRNTLTSWLEVGAGGLTVREESFVPFIIAIQNQTFVESTPNRYLDTNETLGKMREAIASLNPDMDLRIRYRATTYEVQSGDTGFGIGRKAGVPFFLIQEANPGRDLSVLSPGDIINLPSRDEMVPLDPVANKRIVVNLDTQSMVAYENDEIVFDWPISSGISQAPTSPGVYQILSHVEVAFGSSYTLCDESGCGQWEMQWFMGLYEPVPGLVNGFHGAVALPDGGYLGGNQVGTPFTLGCVMSRDDQAKLLYDWADEGTIVEIISFEFDPESQLARSAFA